MIIRGDFSLVTHFGIETADLPVPRFGTGTGPSQNGSDLEHGGRFNLQTMKPSS